MKKIENENENEIENEIEIENRRGRGRERQRTRPACNRPGAYSKQQPEASAYTASSYIRHACCAQVQNTT